MIGGDPADNDHNGAEFMEVLLRLEFLLRNVGTPGKCSGPHCGAPILWVRYANGTPAPFNHNGESHFATCPDADRFKRAKRTDRTPTLFGAEGGK